MYKWLILIGLLVLLFVLGTPSKKNGGEWKVFGSMECGWTRKQLKHLEDNRIAHTFVDCSKGQCPDVDAFPTLKHSQSGETIVGFNEVQ